MMQCVPASALGGLPSMTFPVESGVNTLTHAMSVQHAALPHTKSYLPAVTACYRPRKLHHTPRHTHTQRWRRSRTRPKTAAAFGSHLGIHNMRLITLAAPANDHSPHIPYTLFPSPSRVSLHRETVLRGHAPPCHSSPPPGVRSRARGKRHSRQRILPHGSPRAHPPPPSAAASIKTA